MAVLTEHAKEKSTYVIPVNFKDEEGTAVTPKSATWTLTDEDGNVINDREDVSISPLASSVNVVLSGDDLEIEAGAYEERSTSGIIYRVAARYFTVKAVYDSDLGSNLPLNDEAAFWIDDLIGIENI